MELSSHSTLNGLKTLQILDGAFLFHAVIKPPPMAFLGAAKYCRSPEITYFTRHASSNQQFQLSFRNVQNIFENIILSTQYRSTVFSIPCQSFPAGSARHLFERPLGAWIGAQGMDPARTQIAESTGKTQEIWWPT